MNRIYHTWDKWECYPAGFFNAKPPAGMSDVDCEIKYRDFLSDLTRFESALVRILDEWKMSCEHNLTNVSMNRIAWLGQAAMCIDSGIPSRFRGGYNLLSDEQKYLADQLALKYLNIWLAANGREELTVPDAQSKTEMNLY